VTTYCEPSRLYSPPKYKRCDGASNSASHNHPQPSQFIIHLSFGSTYISLLAYLFIYSMEQSPSWVANRFPASQEIPRILWNPNVHYHIHKCLLTVSIVASLIQFIPHVPISENSS
jgi:hypothetical protein